MLALVEPHSRPEFLAVTDELFYSARDACSFRAALVIVCKKFEGLTTTPAFCLSELVSAVALSGVGLEVFLDVVGNRANPPFARLVDTHGRNCNW